MARLSKMTHDEHVELAKKLCVAFANVHEAYVYVSNKNGVSSREARQLARLFKQFDSTRAALDSAYHAVTSDAQFAGASHVYYKPGLEE